MGFEWWMIKLRIFWLIRLLKRFFFVFLIVIWIRFFFIFVVMGLFVVGFVIVFWYLRILVRG